MPAHEIAAQWYFDLLRAELTARGSVEAALRLDYFLRVAPPQGVEPAGTVELTVQHRLTDYEVRLNAETGELISWFADFLAKDGDESMPREQALEMARQTGQVPSDGAELEMAEYEVMADRTLFRARWKHVSEGLEVDGDYIEVLINGKMRRPFSMNRVWRTPNLAGSPVVR